MFNIHKDINTASVLLTHCPFYTMHNCPRSDITDFKISFPSIHLASAKLHLELDKDTEFEYSWKLNFALNSHVHYLNLGFMHKQMVHLIND